MKTISANEFDKMFDEGETDILQYADLSRATRPNQTKNVNVALPTWMINGLDAEATRLGISRQAVIKVLLGSCLDKAKAVG